MKILMIEDDSTLGEAVCAHLKKEGYSVDLLSDGENGLYYAMQGIYDLILLDRMLPKLDGIALLRALRKNNVTTPVLLLTALNAIGDRVDGLDAGADDYLVKPFAMEELLARIRALTRRPNRIEQQSALCFGDLTFSPLDRKLTGPNGECVLSKTEAVLMELFLRNPGQVLPREIVYLRVWGPDTEVEEKSVDNYIHFIRRRLKSSGSACRIETIRSIGYRMGCKNES